MNPLRRTLVGIAILGSTLGGAAIGIASTGSANAATSGTTSTTAAASTAATDSGTATPAADDGSTRPAPPDGQSEQGGPHGQPGDPGKGGHVANGITETVLTGDDATKATAAAEAAVPGGTIDRVENDAEGATFEAHVTKADGSHVTVKLNADFSVASVEDGFA